MSLNMSGVERKVELEQSLFLERLLLRLSDRLTQEVAKACAAAGISPPMRVVLSLKWFNECQREEECWSEICGYYDCEREEVVLSLPCAARKGDRAEALLRTIAHELVHRCQHAAGPLCRVHRTCNELRLLNVMLPYKQRPHEVEAYAREGELAEALRPYLERPIKELWDALTIRLRFSDPPPFKANLLYVEPGGKGLLSGPGFTAELAGEVGISEPILLYWPTSTGLDKELNVDLVSTSGGGVYVIVGSGATRAFRSLSGFILFSMIEEAERNPHASLWWEYSIRPEWVRRDEYGDTEINFPYQVTEGSLTIVKLKVSEKTLPYQELMERLLSRYGEGRESASQRPAKMTVEDLERVIKKFEEFLYMPDLPESDLSELARQTVPQTTATAPAVDEASKTSPTPAPTAHSADADTNDRENPEG